MSIKISWYKVSNFRELKYQSEDFDVLFIFYIQTVYEDLLEIIRKKGNNRIYPNNIKTVQKY